MSISPRALGSPEGGTDWVSRQSDWRNKGAGRWVGRIRGRRDGPLCGRPFGHQRGAGGSRQRCRRAHSILPHCPTCVKKNPSLFSFDARSRQPIGCASAAGHESSGHRSFPTRAERASSGEMLRSAQHDCVFHSLRRANTLPLWRRTGKMPVPPACPFCVPACFLAPRSLLSLRLCVRTASSCGRIGDASFLSALCPLCLCG